MKQLLASEKTKVREDTYNFLEDCMKIFRCGHVKPNCDEQDTKLHQLRLWLLLTFFLPLMRASKIKNFYEF
jgi:hypothetical protein